MVEYCSVCGAQASEEFNGKFYCSKHASENVGGSSFDRILLGGSLVKKPELPKSSVADKVIKGLRGAETENPSMDDIVAFHSVEQPTLPPKTELPQNIAPKKPSLADEIIDNFDKVFSPKPEIVAAHPPPVSQPPPTPAPKREITGWVRWGARQPPKEETALEKLMQRVSHPLQPSAPPLPRTTPVPNISEPVVSVPLRSLQVFGDEEPTCPDCGQKLMFKENRSGKEIWLCNNPECK